MPVSGTTNDGVVATAAGEAETLIPLNSDRTIEVSTDVDGRVLSANIILPSETNLEAGKVADDVTVVYEER